MEQAHRFLETGLDENALQSLTQSVNALRQAGQESATSLAQSIGLPPLSPPTLAPDPKGQGRGGSLADQESLDVIPDGASINETRDVLQELYRRAGQNERSPQELDYIKRLIAPFQPK